MPPDSMSNTDSAAQSSDERDTILSASKQPGGSKRRQSLLVYATIPFASLFAILLPVTLIGATNQLIATLPGGPILPNQNDTGSQATKNNTNSSPGTQAQKPDNSSQSQNSNSQESTNITTLVVNGKNIPVPDDGNFHKSVNESSGSTDISYSSSQGSANGSSENTRSVNINVRSSRSP